MVIPLDFLIALLPFLALGVVSLLGK